MSKNNVFEEASDLAIQLRADGADDKADAISDAVRSGSTGSEILNNLGVELSLLLKDRQTPMSQKTRDTANRLLKQVDKMLRSS